MGWRCSNSLKTHRAATALEENEKYTTVWNKFPHVRLDLAGRGPLDYCVRLASLRRPTRLSAPSDSPLCAVRFASLRRPTRLSAPSDSDIFAVRLAPCPSCASFVPVAWDVPEWQPVKQDQNHQKHSKITYVDSLKTKVWELKKHGFSWFWRL